MQFIFELFGSGKELHFWQMAVRSVIVFLYALLLIRIAGRRSFSFHAPLDNIILLLLGATLSRAVVGASPFLPTLGASLILCFLHRLFAFMSLHIKWFSKFTKAEKILLFSQGKFNIRNLKKTLVSMEDVMEEIRKHFHTNSLDQIDVIYIERNGEISAMKKKSEK